MNILKKIRIATGVKKIELTDGNLGTIQIGDVLKEHRDALISSLLSDLGTYIGYHFSTPPKKDQIENIRQKLIDLKKTSISMSKYSALISEVLEKETTYVRSELFYHEINEVIGDELNPSQLILVK